MCVVVRVSENVPPSAIRRKLPMMRLRVLSLLALTSCGSARVTASSSTSQASSQELRASVTADGECLNVTVMENGSEGGAICATAARARGLTMNDLTDGWTPAMFAPTADGQVPSFH